MKPISHASNNRALQAPAGWHQSGLPVDPLCITDQVIEGVPCVWSFWKPDAEELAALNAGMPVILSLVGHTMPPALLMVEAIGIDACARAKAEGRVLPSAQSSPGPVTQPWVHGISMMQQSVLLAAVRGPDGLAKYGGGAKMLLRWFRRCILLSAMDKRVLRDPIEPNGGSFTGPSLDGPDDVDHWSERMQVHVNDYLRQLDALPHHWQMHFMHAIEIVGYKHPDHEIRHFWRQVYLRLVHDMHVWPETEEQLDERLGDSRSGWLKRADPATKE